MWIDLSILMSFDVYMWTADVIFVSLVWNRAVKETVYYCKVGMVRKVIFDLLRDTYWSLLNFGLT